MIINVMRQGGFANITRTTRIDTERLTPAHAKEVKEELAKLASSDKNGSDQVYDRFNYTISYDDKSGHHQIVRDEKLVAPLLMAAASS